MLREYLKNNANNYKLAIERLEDLLSEEDKFKYFDITDYDVEIRFKRALKANFKILAIDRDEKSAILSSDSGKIYITTSKGCTCPDYQDHENICKHMIFLFINLGLIDKDGSIIKQEIKNIPIPPKAYDNVKICCKCGCIFPLNENFCPSCKCSNFKYNYNLQSNENEQLEPIALIVFILMIGFILFCFIGMFL